MHGMFFEPHRKRCASRILLLFLVLTSAPEMPNAQNTRTSGDTILPERREFARAKNDLERPRPFYDSTLLDSRYLADRRFEIRYLDRGDREAPLRSTQIIIILSILLAAVLLIGLYRLRKGKQALAAQNALIRQQAEQLKSLDAAKSRFFAQVSYELRTPLTLLLGPVHALLQENQLTEKQAQLLHMADRSGKQLEQLINEILDLRKLETGKLGLDEKPTELSAFFAAYFAQFEYLAERSRINFSVVLALPGKASVRMDQEKCRQILFHLLSNAFKFTPAGGQITAKAAFENGLLHLAVSDTGPGIHPADLPHVFDRFFQTGQPDRPADGGAGIGLNLCREYARILGGTIRAESTPGQGSVFRVVFPVTLLEAPGEIPFSPTTQTEMSGKAKTSPSPGAVEHFLPARPTILVVEDHPDLQDYIRLILEERYHVVVAKNGQAALDWLLPAAHCQLILSDLMMPVMDGFQLLEKLKSNDLTRHIPVIILTARVEAQDRLKALRIGVDDYLTKPFEEDELLARIENLVKNQAARQLEIAAGNGPEMHRPMMSQPDREWLETFETYVRQHYADGTLSVPGLAYAFAMSESTLLRQLKRLTGLSPVQYLQEVRLHEAWGMLESRTCYSIGEVAARVGYDDTRSFSRSFRQRFGKLPSEMLSAGF